jgi:hypothetical protein
LSIGLAGAASAQMQCPGGSPCNGATQMTSTVAGTFTPQPPAWNTDILLPSFDDALGDLVGVHVRATAPVTAFFGAENIDGGAGCPGGTWSIDTLLDLVFVQGAVPLFNQDPVSILTQFGPLGPFDGTLDFGGSSGESLTYSSEPIHEECFSAQNELDWFRSSVVGPQVLFTGRTGPATASVGSGCNSLVVSSMLDVGMEVEITYTYCVPVGLAYCFGDGAGAPCPCANEGAPGHGCANASFSGGCALVAAGDPSVGMDTLALTATDTTPGQPGLFFQGDNAVNGGSGLPFGDGLRCAGGNVVRLEVVTSDGAGTATSSVPIAATGGASAGDLLRYQWWYRDPAGSPCGYGFNLSNGLEIFWTP